MKMVRQMCGMKLTDRLPGTQVRERLILEDIVAVITIPCGTGSMA